MTHSMASARNGSQVVEAVNVARHHGVPVFFVIREHHPSGIDIEHTRSHLFKKGGAGATVAGTEGARLVDALKASRRAGDPG